MLCIYQLSSSQFNISSYSHLRSLPLLQNSNMYARSASIALLALPLLASAAALRRGGVLPSGSCDPAGLQCCATSQAVCISSTSAVGDKLMILKSNRPRVALLAPS